MMCGTGFFIAQLMLKLQIRCQSSNKRLKKGGIILHRSYICECQVTYCSYLICFVLPRKSSYIIAYCAQSGKARSCQVSHVNPTRDGRVLQMSLFVLSDNVVIQYRHKIQHHESSLIRKCRPEKAVEYAHISARNSKHTSSNALSKKY